MKARVTEATANQIAGYMYANGLSEDDLAAQCNVSAQTIRRLIAKKGRQQSAQMHTARLVAKGLGVEIPDLFGGAK